MRTAGRYRLVSAQSAHGPSGRSTGRPHPTIIGGRKRDTLAKSKAEPEKPRGNKPQFIVRAKQAPDSEYMQTIGAAWPFREGEGFVVKLHSLPIKWDGDMILVPPKSEDE